MIEDGFWLAAIVDVLEDYGFTDNKANDLKDGIEKRAEERQVEGVRIRKLKDAPTVPQQLLCGSPDGSTQMPKNCYSCDKRFKVSDCDFAFGSERCIGHFTKR